ncbi:MAG: anti-sigma-K factor RskA [Cellvibrionaceae bacterium]|jgi:anti-sigma-K factor RskA
MDDEQDIQDLIASYALGSLDNEEVAKVESLLSKSNSARQELAQFQQVVDLIGAAAPAIEPSTSFEDRLFSRIVKTAAEAPAVVKPRRIQPVVPTLFERLSELFARPTLQMAGGLAMVLLLFSSGFLMVQNRQIQSELDFAISNNGLPTFELASINGIESNTGLVVMSLDGVNGTVIIDGMTPPADDSQYQLWLIQDNDVEAGPTFELNEKGYGARWVLSAKPLNSYNYFMVTLEPAGGSLQPTSDPVLEWKAAEATNR